MKKTFVSIVFLSVVAAVVLAGCSNSDAPKASDAPAAPSTNAPAPAK